MSDQFDKKLVDRINKVFDEYEDESADKGWQELRTRYPEKEKTRVLWWYSSAAAILLIAGCWFFLASPGIEQDEQKIAKKVSDEKITIDTTELYTSRKSFATPLFEDNKSFLSGSTHLKKVRRSSKTDLPYSSDAPIVTEYQQEQDQRTKSRSLDDLTIMALTRPQSPAIANSPGSQSETTVTSTDTTHYLTGITTSSEEEKVLPSEVLTKEELNALLKPEARKKQSVKKSRRATFGFVAGSYLNYAEGSQTSINTGVGVTSDLRISKKLKISSGLSFGQHTLKYGEPPREVASRLARSAMSDAVAPLSFSSLAPVASSYSINSLEANLIGFDIPINLRYTVISKKNKLFLSTGFSSNFFIKESYTYQYDYQTSMNNNTMRIPNQENSSSHQSFEFGRILNVSLGLDHPINKNSNLTFEPFVKYPLGGLGAQNLRFGAAGVNLKLNFNSFK